METIIKFNDIDFSFFETELLPKEGIPPPLPYDCASFGYSNAFINSILCFHSASTPSILQTTLKTLNVLNISKVRSSFW